MSEILIPLDFSKASGNAIEYGLELARTFGLSIRLLHVYTPMGVSVDDMAYVDHTEIRGEFEARLIEAKEAALDRIRDEENISVETELDYGFPARKILEWSKSEQCSIIVIGSKGDIGALEKLFGTVSSDVAINAHCPVIIVPANYNIQPIHHILYSAKYEDLDKKLIVFAGKFVKAFESILTIVHHTESDKDDYHLEEVKSVVKSVVPEVHVDVELEHNDKFPADLSIYVHERDVDLVIMASKHRNLIHRIFHHSPIRTMAYTADIPLCILHEGGHWDFI